MSLLKDIPSDVWKLMSSNEKYSAMVLEDEYLRDLRYKDRESKRLANPPNLKNRPAVKMYEILNSSTGETFTGTQTQWRMKNIIPAGSANGMFSREGSIYKKVWTAKQIKG